MTCLADYSQLTIDQQMAILEQMLQDKRDDERARVQRYETRTLSKLATTAEIIPPCTDAVAAGNSIKESA